jgi:hypothetical protein
MCDGHPSDSGKCKTGRIMVHAYLGKMQYPISKIIGAKRAAGLAQVIERLPSQCDVLSLNLSTATKKKHL